MVYRCVRWVALGLSVVLGACSDPAAELPPPLPQDPLVKVYFNHNQAAEYTNPYRSQTRRGDNLEQIIIDTIAQADRSLDLAVQELRLPKIAEALVRRHEAGVKVRVILENQYSRGWSDYSSDEIAELDTRKRNRYDAFRQLADRDGDAEVSEAEASQADAVAIVRDAGIPIIDDTADGSKGSGLMHHKFAIADGRHLIVSSANFTNSGIHGDIDKPASRGNANHLFAIDAPELAGIFEAEFDLMWGDGPGGEPDSQFGLQKPFRPVRDVVLGETLVSVKFSPTSRTLDWDKSTNGAIARALERTDTSANLALFVFSEQQLVDVLRAQHREGATIKALIDPSFAYRSYSEGLDMLGVALPDRRCRYEKNNRPWQDAITTVGVPILPPGDKLHHKFAAIDDRMVVTGSHNWSNAANRTNDETLLIVQSPTVAAHFTREFDRLYDNATLGVTSTLQRKIEQKQRTCQSN